MLQFDFQDPQITVYNTLFDRNYLKLSPSELTVLLRKETLFQSISFPRSLPVHWPLFHWVYFAYSPSCINRRAPSALEVGFELQPSPWQGYRSWKKMIPIKSASEKCSKNACLCPSSGKSKRTENLQHHLRFGQCPHTSPSLPRDV